MLLCLQFSQYGKHLYRNHQQTVKYNVQNICIPVTHYKCSIRMLHQMDFIFQCLAFPDLWGIKRTCTAVAQSFLCIHHKIIFK